MLFKRLMILFSTAKLGIISYLCNRQKVIDTHQNTQPLDYKQVAFGSESRFDTTATDAANLNICKIARI